jgi:RNA polymerase sigma-70 factor, ECF subfamily
VGRQSHHQAPEDRFAAVFGHLGAVVAYARRRGAADPEAIAAEVMTIAWRRLVDVPRDDARPWLYATARNLVRAEYRRRLATTAGSEPGSAAAADVPPLELDPPLARALFDLSPSDREALLLVAWEDLTPTQAARALGIQATAFRVRLLRARRRMRQAPAKAADEQDHLHARPELETT